MLRKNTLKNRFSNELEAYRRRKRISTSKVSSFVSLQYHGMTNFLMMML